MIIILLKICCVGAPRKTNNLKDPSHHQPHSDEQNTGTNLDAVTNQLSELAVGGGRGIEGTVIESDSSSESSESECDERVVLERAKVEGLDLERLEVGPDGKAPLELVSQVNLTILQKFSVPSLFC